MKEKKIIIGFADISDNVKKPEGKRISQIFKMIEDEKNHREKGRENNE